jgi:hypothetical protein
MPCLVLFIFAVIGGFSGWEPMLTEDKRTPAMLVFSLLYWTASLALEQAVRKIQCRSRNKASEDKGENGSSGASQAS